MDQDDQDLLDAADLRQKVLEIILSGAHVSREVARLRLLLFIRAATDYYSHNQNSCLEPFPSCFFNGDTNTRLYADLRTHILNIPQLTTIQETTTLPELTWSLLHWIFTNPLNITPLADPAIRNVLTDDLREKTKLTSIPYPSKTCKLYEMNPDIPKKKFIAGKKEFGSFYGFHGSPAQNFHSIIHRGLISSLNVVGAYGKGTYLTSDLNTARSYAQKCIQTYSQPTGNTNSLNVTHNTGDSYCIAIVEVVKHPSIKVVDFGGRWKVGSYQQTNGTQANNYTDDTTKYYVVDRDEFLQLRNLLVFENKEIYDY